MKKNRKDPFHTTWKDYLTFNRREQYGIYALLFIFLIQLTCIYFLDYSQAVKPAVQSRWITDSVKVWIKSEQKDQRQSREWGQQEAVQLKKKEISYFRFDPNTVTVDQLVLLGLNKGQVRTIEKFRSKGAGFKTKEDFKKLYCISPQEFEKLNPWIDLPDSIAGKGKQFERKVFRKELRIDISKDDSLQILKLPGIGPAFTGRIVNYRKKLGGFTSLEQLKEVWGMTDSLYSLIEPLLFISDTIPEKFPLNSVDQNTLARHPYTGYSIAKVIIKYREQHGPFSDISDIKKVPLVSDEIFRKLAPYLVLESRDSIINGIREE
jgi:DNA uptake protein ComE-like DNA-binding protein